MGVWAGPLHELVELRSLRRVRETPLDRVSFTDGLSGRRRARFAPVVRRQWSCEVFAVDPAGMASLLEFYWSHRGRAVWLVTEAAAVQNVLPPPSVVRDRERDVMVPDGWVGSGLTAAGRVPTVDGVAAASVLVDGAGSAAGPVVPVVAGLPVTVSAYAGEGGTVSLAWVDADGVETTEAVSAAAGPGSAMQRVSVSVPQVPAGRTACRLVVDGADVYARPQVTWTSAPVQYVPGLGAPSVIFGPPREDVLVVLPDGSRNLSGFSYSVSEVG